MTASPRLPHLLAAVAAALCLVPAGPAAAAVLPAGTTAILSGSTALDAALPAPVSTATTGPATVSQDGRFVAFIATSDGLVEGDDDTIDNVYVKDRATGTVTLASRATGATGEPAHQNCFDPAISDDGRRVAFACYGPLDPADTNQAADVYLRDLPAAATVLVSRAPGLGAVGNGASRQPALDEDGDAVAFTSAATNLETVGTSDERVYRRQIGNGDAVTLVSRKSATAGNAPSFGTQPSMTDDGARIAYTAPGSVAPDAADTNQRSDVYVRDLGTGVTALVSRKDGNGGAVGNGASNTPAIAGDGSAVAFQSTSTNLAAEDTDSGVDVYRRALTVSVTALVSVTFGGDKGQDSHSPSIDDSGWRVAFVSAGTGLDPADTSAVHDIYLKDMQFGGLELVSRRDGDAGTAANAGAMAASISGDGTKVALGLRRGITPDSDPHELTVALRDVGSTPQRTATVSRPAGDAPFRNAGGASSAAALSADGRYAAFASEAPALGLPDDVDEGVFVRDRVTGAITLASRADGPDGAPLHPEDDLVAISADGRRVAFYAGDQVWVRDLPSARTLLASRADGADGAPGDGPAIDLALDADGSRVAFSTTAANLGDGDADTEIDVHVRDLATGRTLLASRAPGTDGAKADANAYGVDIDASGSRVSFISGATNLPGAGAFTQAYVRDLAAATTTHVSTLAPEFGTNLGASQASIDAAGRRVAYTSPAPLMLAPGDPVSIVLVRDLETGTIRLASRDDDGTPADGNSADAQISPDGGVVAFSSTAPLAGVPADGVARVFRRDVAAGRTALVSRRSGAAGAPVTRQSRTGTVSDGGRCVSFTTSDALAGPPASHRESFLRVFAGDCSAPVAGGPGGGGAGGGGGEAAASSRGTRPRPCSSACGSTGAGCAAAAASCCASAPRRPRRSASRSSGGAAGAPGCCGGRSPRGPGG